MAEQPEVNPPKLCHQGRLHLASNPVVMRESQEYRCTRCGKIRFKVKNLKLEKTWEEGLRYCQESIRGS